MLATIVVFSKPWCPGLTVIRPWLMAWDLGLLLIWFRVPGTGAPNPPPAEPPPPPPVRPCLFASSTTMRFNWPTGFSSGTSKPRSHQALRFLWTKNKSCPIHPCLEVGISFGTIMLRKVAQFMVKVVIPIVYESIFTKFLNHPTLRPSSGRHLMRAKFIFILLESSLGWSVIKKHHRDSSVWWCVKNYAYLEMW